MKLRIRIISLILIFVLFPFMVVPAFAADFDNSGWVDLLDFTSVDTNGNFFQVIGGNSKAISLKCPDTNILYFADILVQYGAATGVYPSLSVSYSTTKVLEMHDLGGGLVRYYGAIPMGNYSSLYLTFTPPNSTTYNATMLSCNVSSFKTFYSKLGASALISADGQEDRSIIFSGEVTSATMYDELGDGDIPSFWFSLTDDDWKQYDYIDLLLGFHVGGISSFSATYGDMLIPISVQHLDSGFSTVSTTNVVYVRLDLRNINRSSDDHVLVTFNGNLGYGLNIFSISDCQGYVDSSVNPLFYYFKDLTANLSSYFSSLSSNINSWISSQTSSLLNGLVSLRDSISSEFTLLKNHIVSFYNWIYSNLKNYFDSISNTVSTWGQNIVTAINPDPDAGEDAKDQGAEKGQEIGNLNDQMNSMVKPDLSGSGDISGIISPGDLTNYTTFLTTVVNAPYISQVVMLSLILSLAGYVLFGKR